MQIVLSRTQAGIGRSGKQEQEQTSRNHVTLFLADLCISFYCPLLGVVALQRSAKKYANLAKQDPGRVRQIR